LHSKSGVAIQHWAELIADYDETAALVSALDLTITVCTAVVHLAGALGRPVWVAAPHSPEWRYGFSGETMAWYPSARLYRQQADGNWDPVIRTIADALRAHALQAPNC
jgi:ADP-heptose:LPS heptosyltransferase